MSVCVFFVFCFIFSYCAPLFYVYEMCILLVLLKNDKYNNSDRHQNTHILALTTNPIQHNAHYLIWTTIMGHHMLQSIGTIRWWKKALTEPLQQIKPDWIANVIMILNAKTTHTHTHTLKIKHKLKKKWENDLEN